MKLVNFNNAINSLEMYLSIKRKEIDRGNKSEEAFNNNWNKEKEKINKEYLDLKLQTIHQYEEDLKPFDMAYLSIYIGFYDKNIDYILENGPIEFLKERTIRDIETNYDYYILGDVATNHFGIRHDLVNNIEAIFDELYDDDGPNPFEDEKEAFSKMFTIFYLLNQGLYINKEYYKIQSDKQIHLVLSVFDKVKERQKKLDALDWELFYKIRDLNFKNEKLHHQKVHHYIDYDLIEQAKSKYIYSLKGVYGGEVYRIFLKIVDELVDDDQNKFIRLAKNANIKTVEELHDLLDETFYGNF